MGAHKRPHSSVDRALPSGGRSPRSSRGGGTDLDRCTTAVLAVVLLISPSACYNHLMDPDLKAYLDRYHAVAEVQQQELQSASLELRWQQLNAVVALAIGLGILKPDKSEEDIYLLWAKLKNNPPNPLNPFP